MPFKTTSIEGLLLFEPQVWGDERGYFYESYNEAVFHEAGITNTFIQDNQAFSSRGILRGLHYQIGDFAQAKLVRVLSGRVLDVVVDLREGSQTYGQSYSVELSGESHLQLFVPRHFAHGYLVLSETAIFCYKCDNVYSKAHEGGIYYNDPQLGIDWQLEATDFILSEKDQILPPFGKHRT